MTGTDSPRPVPRAIDNYPDDLPFPVCHDCGALDPVVAERTTACLICGYKPDGHADAPTGATPAGNAALSTDLQDDIPSDHWFCRDCGAPDPVVTGRASECLVCGYTPVADDPPSPGAMSVLAVAEAALPPGPRPAPWTRTM